MCIAVVVFLFVYDLQLCSWWGVPLYKPLPSFFPSFFPPPSFSPSFSPLPPEGRLRLAFGQGARQERNPVAPLERRPGGQTQPQEPQPAHLAGAAFGRRETGPQAPRQVHVWHAEAQGAWQGEGPPGQGVASFRQPDGVQQRLGGVGLFPPLPPHAHRGGKEPRGAPENVRNQDEALGGAGGLPVGQVTYYREGVLFPAVTKFSLRTPSSFKAPRQSLQACQGSLHRSLPHPPPR